MNPRTTRSHRWLLAGIVLALVIVAGLRVDWAVFQGSLPTLAATSTAKIASGGVHGVFIEPQDGLSPVIDEIDAARKSVDVEVYLLSSDEIVAALKRAKGRNATVRVVIERQPYKSEQDKSITRSQLQAKGFQVRFGSSRYTYTHAKFVIVDRRVGIVLTANFTHAVFSGNRDLGVTTTVPNEVAELQQVFDADWNDAPTPLVESLVLSPTNSRTSMDGLVAGANERIDVYAEEMFDDTMIQAFIAAEARGVAVRILVPSSDDADQHANIDKLTAAGVEVGLLDNPKLHAKMILVDDLRVFVGSQNMSANSIEHNREVGLILTEPANIARLGKAFTRDFTSAPSAAVRN